MDVVEQLGRVSTVKSAPTAPSAIAGQSNESAQPVDVAAECADRDLEPLRSSTPGQYRWVCSSDSSRSVRELVFAIVVSLP